MYNSWSELRRSVRFKKCYAMRLDGRRQLTAGGRTGVGG